eukprot:408875-Prymnesium_polylepis.1
MSGSHRPLREAVQDSNRLGLQDGCCCQVAWWWENQEATWWAMPMLCGASHSGGSDHPKECSVVEVCVQALPSDPLR